MKIAEIEEQHFNNAMRRYIAAVGQYKSAKENMFYLLFLEAIALFILFLGVNQYSENVGWFREYGMYTICLLAFIASFIGAIFCIWQAMTLMNKKEEMQKSYIQMRNNWTQLSHSKK